MRHRRDAGAVPVEFAAAIGLLMFPVLVFVMTIAPVVERRTVAGRAAAEAARAFVVAPDEARGLASAQSIIDQMAAAHPFDLSLSLSGGLERGARVSVSVTVEMPVVIFPGVAQLDVAGYTATHIEEVDLLRSLP